MNTMDNAKVMEALEKQTLFNYFDKLTNAAVSKLSLFSVFPFTGAPNLSDPHPIIKIEDLTKLIALNTGRFDN